jgi:hypothetical protein
MTSRSFSSPILWQWKAFHCQSCGDQFLKISLCLDFDCLIDNGLISTIDLATKIAIV